MRAGPGVPDLVAWELAVTEFERQVAEATEVTEREEQELRSRERELEEQVRIQVDQLEQRFRKGEMEWVMIWTIS